MAEREVLMSSAAKSQPTDIQLQLNDIQLRVVKALEKGGGALSPSEIVLVSALPYDVLTTAVKGLEKQGLVAIKALPNSDIDLVVLNR
jgi:hypothetical protein